MKSDWVFYYGIAVAITAIGVYIFLKSRKELDSIVEESRFQDALKELVFVSVKRFIKPYIDKPENKDVVSDIAHKVKDFVEKEIDEPFSIEVIIDDKFFHLQNQAINLAIKGELEGYRLVRPETKQILKNYVKHNLRSHLGNTLMKIALFIWISLIVMQLFLKDIV